MSDNLPNIKKLLNRREASVSNEVYAVASHYPGYVRVYIPNNPIYKLDPYWEISRKSLVDISKAESKSSNGSPEERSIRRSKKLISDYLACNRFELFGTITFGGKNRHDLNHTKKQFNTWIKNQRDRNGKFKYVFVPEYHKDGALHFHGVFANYNGKLNPSRNTKTNRLIYSKSGKQLYDLSEFKLGFTRVEKIGSTLYDQARVSNYIRKYITKDMVNIFGKKRFWSSRGLSKPIYEDNPDWYLNIEPDEIYENDYGKIYTYKNLDNKDIPALVKTLTLVDHQ